ncbi:MAG TPA: hypothetical protein VFW60_03735 [Rhodanobacteraceae bacterium]|nr:hypothetical protein [Rhodanobacteraceae bacterium]
MLVLLVSTNLAFVPASDWQLRGGELQQFLTGSRKAFMSRYAPIDHMVKVVDHRFGPNARVLIASSGIPDMPGHPVKFGWYAPYGAGFAGRAYVVNWYDHRLQLKAMQADVDRSGKAWGRLIRETGANLLLLQTGHVSTALGSALRAARCTLVFEFGDLQLWQIGHAIAGTLRPSEPGTIRLAFDVSEVPQGAVLANAKVAVGCGLRGEPVLVSWVVEGRGLKPWRYWEWANCTSVGIATATLDVAIPRSVTRFDVSTRPAKAVNMDLRLVSSSLSVRRDFGRQRDLARRMRHDLASAVASWLDPWSRKSVMHDGIPVSRPASATGIIVSFHSSAEPPLPAARMHAILAMTCRQSPNPIVVSWNLTTEGQASQATYQHIVCDRRGLAYAVFDGTVTHRLTSFKVVALPANNVDMRLRLVSAKAGFVRDTRMAGVVNRMRLELARGIDPAPEVIRVGP